MGYYLGQFYFDRRDLFLVLAILLLLWGNYTRFPLPFFRYQDLILLLLVFVMSKGFLPATVDGVLLILFLAAVLLTLFIPLFQVLIFVVLSFVFLKIAKII
jgi:hypothetical protein